MSHGTTPEAGLTDAQANMQKLRDAMRVQSTWRDCLRLQYDLDTESFILLHQTWPGEWERVKVSPLNPSMMRQIGEWFLATSRLEGLQRGKEAT